MRVEWGSFVWLDYDLLLDSGAHIGSSEASGPLWIWVGDPDVLPGLAEKLVGLQEGDERLIRLTPPEGFGDWDPDALLTMRDYPLPGDPRLEDGMIVRIESNAGNSAVCRVYRVTDERVALDFNHPLAGEPLILFVRVRQVVPPILGGPVAAGKGEGGARIGKVARS
ncbi:MAG TPA: FKBP-type peptidyl-prolyl cis-trans isomerase [Candidatus Methylomirabilis sp.]